MQSSWGCDVYTDPDDPEVCPVCGGPVAAIWRMNGTDVAAGRAVASTMRNCAHSPVMAGSVGMHGEDEHVKHSLYFYRNSHERAQQLWRYVSEGLDQDQACVVAAAAPHLAELGASLAESGRDVTLLRKSGRYFELDAEETLWGFMRGDMPVASLFDHTVGDLIREVGQQARHVRVYGEMVSMLWAQGKTRAALRVEEYWNDLQITVPFSLVCAYPEFRNQSPGRPEICARHDHLILEEDDIRASSAG